MVSQFADSLMMAQGAAWAAVNDAKGMPDFYRTELITIAQHMDDVMRKYIYELEQKAGKL